MKKEFLEVGKIVGTHGKKGAVRIDPWADSAESICDFKRMFIDSDKKELRILSLKPHGRIALCEFEGTDSIERAEKLRGKTVYIKREDAFLDKDRYFVEELIGCKVYDIADNKYLGDICEVSKTGANDVWHIKNESGEYLIPVIEEVIRSVDIESEKILISPLKGIFDNAD